MKKLFVKTLFGVELNVLMIDLCIYVMSLTHAIIHVPDMFVVQAAEAFQT